ncbi:MAG: hypothetical protein Kow0022_11280 [Phycisphaerales bacterium]
MSEDQRPEHQNVGRLLRAFRERRSLSLDELAKRAGCAKSYLSAVENGHKGPPSEALLHRLESALGIDDRSLIHAAMWARTPAPVRREVAELTSASSATRHLCEIIRAGGSLDEAYRSGKLRGLVDAIAAADEPRIVESSLPLEVPLINRVAAGYPADFTDLGYPARVADEYVRCPGLTDPDAFAARIVGDSMMPEYREGDIVVFSPARRVASGDDCFVRIAPDHESTFKRVYFEGQPGSELIRLQPINNRYPPRVLPREQVLGLYRAVSVTRMV